MGNNFLKYSALTIAIIGAVNWGLIGFFNFNLVSMIFGSMSLSANKWGEVYSACLLADKAVQ